MSIEKLWLIWSNTSKGYWKPGSSGYTDEICEAGLYSEGQALSAEKSTTDTRTGTKKDIAIKPETWRKIAEMEIDRLRRKAESLKRMLEA